MNSPQSASTQYRSAQSPVLDQEALKEQIATAHGFELYRHYSEAEATKLLRIHLSTIKRARYEDRIGYLRKGTKSIAYFGFHLADFLLSNMTWPSSNEKSIS